VKNPNITEVLVCPSCNDEVHPADYNGEADECSECHYQNASYGECGCEACFEKVLGDADAMMDRMKEDW
jgi:hypothetical protein